MLCKNSCIPIVRRVPLADGNYLQQIIGSTKPGEKKLEFPYTIPTVKTEVELSKDLTKTLYYVTGGIALAVLGSAIINKT